MKLYDLEAFVRNKRPGADASMEEVVLDDIKFKVILDENIIPPLEALEGKANREMILARQRVFAQKEIAHPPAQADLQEALVRDEGNAGAPETPSNIEYEDLGIMPEGAFLFRDVVAFLHVDKRGRIQQIDLVKKRIADPDIRIPANKEFSKMLIQDVKSHEWDELVAHFLKNE